MTELETLYRQARYIVEDDETRFTIRLGEPNEALNELLRKCEAGTWAYMTAYNPNSQPLSDEENQQRQADLISTLEQSDHAYLHGYGTGDDWDPEPSLIVLGIDRDAAIELGKEFGQNAILWGKADGDAELVWCDR